jgi:hypothetical protein
MIVDGDARFGPGAVSVNLGRASLIAFVLTIAIMGLFVWGGVYAALDATDTATMVIGIVIAVVCGLFGLVSLLALPRAAAPRFLVFDERGLHYVRGPVVTVVEWSDIAAIGIGFEQPPNVPKLATSAADLLLNVAEPIVFKKLGIKDLRKVGLEIYPLDRAVLGRHPEFARYQREYAPPRADLLSVRWRIPLPPVIGVAKTVETGARAFAGHRFLGWFRRPWSGGLFGAGRRPVPMLPLPSRTLEERELRPPEH